MKSYIIHFIRHGAIDETLSGKYIGTTDVPLSDKGKMDLNKLDYKYRYPGTQVVFTSPLKRCTETCRILYPEQNPLSIANLSECNFGEWEGKTAEDDHKTALQEVVQKHPDDRLTYTVTGESGPAHDKRFQVTVALNGKALAVGEGRSKKAAEQQAAKAALTKLEQQA